MAVVGDILLTPETGWKRIEQDDVNIKYKGTWTDLTNASFSSGSAKYSPNYYDNRVDITFYVKTTKLRIVSYANPDYAADNIILIDDEAFTFSLKNAEARAYLCFEKLNLTDNIHKIVIKQSQNGTYQRIYLDAIDIDETGCILVPPKTVGDILTLPETGWKRIDDTDSRIKYDGSGWITSTNQYLYGGNEHATNGLGDIVSFKFYGTKLRILSGTFTNNPDGILISIDGTSYTYNQSGTASYKPQTILFEKLGLDLGIHSVIITCPSSTLYMALDCLDIDDTGYLISSKGDQLLQPEIGWQRFDDTDSKIKYIGNWLYQPGVDNYEGGSTIIPVGSTVEEIQSAKCDFYFVGTKLRIINAYYSGSSANYIVEIDGVKNIVTSKKDVLAFQCIIFEKLNLEKTAHHVRIYSGDTDRISLDAFDIDSDGYLITEAEYSQGNKFPVLIGDNTITSETNIANYANSLVNGERQLLISDKLKSIYVTDGQGSYTKLNGDEELIDDTNKSDITTYSSTKIEQLNTEQTRLLMEKSVYDYNNDGVVNSADMASVANKIQGIESAPLYSVYGKSPSGVTGFYEIPIGALDEKNKFQSVRQDVKANVTYSIELTDTNELNDFIIQGYEFLPGEQNVVTTLKEFNNTNKDNFLYDSNNTVFESGMSIKSNFSSESVLNSDGLNEISMSDFLSIYSIDLEVTK